MTKIKPLPPAQHRQGEARLDFRELEGLVVAFQPCLRPDQQRLLGTLGVHVVFTDDGVDPSVADGGRGRYRTEDA